MTFYFFPVDTADYYESAALPAELRRRGCISISIMAISYTILRLGRQAALHAAWKALPGFFRLFLEKLKNTFLLMLTFASVY